MPSILALFRDQCATWFRDPDADRNHYWAGEPDRGVIVGPKTHGKELMSDLVLAHGCLRDGLEPVRHQPPPDPLALRGRLGSSFARSLGDPVTLLYRLRSTAHPCPEISGDPYNFAVSIIHCMTVR